MVVFFSILKSLFIIMSENIYRASCENVKDLRKQRNRLKTLFNRAIKENNEADMQTLTKLYALLYSAFAEVSFLKLIHSPCAFEETEIQHIQAARNLEEKWNKCSELAFQRINTSANLGEIANKKRTLEKICKKYIITPSQIRNKVAHGQWVVCLNNDCTGVNTDITAKLQTVDFVQIDRLFEIYEKFQQCILDLMISPKTHYRDYYQIITALEQYIDLTENWSLETKKNKILGSQKYLRFMSR